MRLTASVQKLFKDRDTENLRLRDRRTEKRRPFVRPVWITFGPGRRDIHEAFAQDISEKGIAVVGQTDVSERTTGWISVSLISCKLVTVRCRAKWTEPFGDGWFLTGWEFDE